MTFTIELTPETVARLEEEATREGVDAPDLVRRLIEQALPAKPKSGREILAALKANGALGAWSHRTDIGDSSEYARELRRQAETREW